IERLAVEGLAAPPASVVGYLDFGSRSVGRDLPDFLPSGPVGNKIDPLAVAGPICTGIVARVSSHASRRAAAGADYIYIRIAARPLRKSEESAIRRPSRRCGYHCLVCDL